jgi:D-3-phosphoglycerate dehydrogenase
MTSYPKEKIKILLLENISGEAVSAFVQNGYKNITRLKTAIPHHELVTILKDVHILGIRSKTQLSHEVFNSAKKLLSVGCFCIGTNQVDLSAATNNGIAVFNAPYSNTRSVAELVIGATIMLMRHVPLKDKYAHRGIWMKDANGCHEVRSKTIGIIGYGNIGSQVSVLAESMGMNVLYYDIQKKLPMGNAKAVNTIAELVGSADVITVHTPNTELTKNLINRELLKEFKSGAIFINYARGEITDIEAIKWGVENKILSGVALDVYPLEPEKNGDHFECILQNAGNVLLTPHIGGSTEEAQVNIGADVSSKLINYMDNGDTNGSLTIPQLNLPVHEHTHRILHIHKNVPGVLSAINSQLSQNGINIIGQYLRTNQDVGYAVLDVDKLLSEEAFRLLKEVKETIKTRILF